MTPAEYAVRGAAGGAMLAVVMNRVLAALNRTWDQTVTDADDETLDRWLGSSIPIVNAGQRMAAYAAVGAAWGLLRASGDAEGPMPRATPQLATRDTPWYTSPVLRLRYHLSEREPWMDAKFRSGNYATELASTDIYTAALTGYETAGKAATARTGKRVAWAKVPAPGCCAWCTLVSGQLYKDATTIPRHAKDRCTPWPVSEGTPRTGHSNFDTIFTSRRRTRR